MFTLLNGVKFYMADISSTLKVLKNWCVRTITRDINFELFSVIYLMRDVKVSLVV